MNFEKVNLPKALVQCWEEKVSCFNFKNLSTDILKISDHFHNPKTVTTPWKSPGAEDAYFAYFFLLNAFRFKAVWNEALRLKFIPENDVFLDFGSGPGVAHLLSSLMSPGLIHKMHCHEIAAEALETHRWLCKKLALPIPTWSKQSITGDWLKQEKIQTAIFSYSLNELEQWPVWLKNCERLILIEPSTQLQGRKLQELRQHLINLGFFIWAPCTHQHECPLLLHSKEDWCHNRIHIDKPKVFAELESHLPMRNDSLTYSYLLAAKAPPPKFLSRLTRVIGDRLDEKGKSRQLICRGNEREFLSWLKREKQEQFIPRGSLLVVPENIQKKANELRPDGPLQIE